ncbi:hypothetical protein [Nonomuraea sp. NPDC052265]|uniref:hypothetical protein n=1 Tax=Nonomuraea sp. NPDC052265 TaxID=3364374 RepID=UPI0037C9A2AF
MDYLFADQGPNGTDRPAAASGWPYPDLFELSPVLRFNNNPVGWVGDPMQAFDDYQRESSRRTDQQREMVRRSTDESARRRDREEWRARRDGGEDGLSLGTQIILAVVALVVFFLVIYPQLPRH